MSLSAIDPRSTLNSGDRPEPDGIAPASSGPASHQDGNPRSNTTSISLLERLRQPEPHEAWTHFVQLYTPLLWYWAAKLGLQDQDAADLVQDVFVRLFQKLPEFQYDRHKSFRTWLQTVTQNIWRDKCRERRKAGRPEGDLAEVSVPDSALEIEEAEYRQRLVGRALELMQTDFHPTTWQAFWGCTVLNRPAAEMAQELGISTASVYVAKSRVLARLRRELADLLD